MTAALKPVQIGVDQLVNIQIDLDPQAGGVVLSVTSCDGPTSLEHTHWQACNGVIEFLLQGDENEESRAVITAGSPTPLESSNQGYGTLLADEVHSEASSQSTATCSGPSTPEQADTVGLQELDDCEKPSSSGLATDVQSQQCASGDVDGENNVPLSSINRPEIDDQSRFSCVKTGDSNSLGSVEDALRETAATALPAESTLPCLDSSPRPEARGPTSSMPGVATPDGKDDTQSGTPPSSIDSEISHLTMQADPDLQSPCVPPTFTADLTACDAEPLTPTTPRQLPNAPLLPPPTDTQRMTLVLDLDGTLIASEDEPHAPVPFDYCVDEERFVWLRPGLRRFLDSVRPHFEVVLFTAAGESWATYALQRIDPDGTIFDSRLYRDHTVSHDDWPWVKDLSRLGRDLARVVIVDDNPLMFMYQPDNALHVAAYDPQLTGHMDDVLEQVLDVLMHKVLIADDVREVLRSLKEPITASCMAARQAAAKAAASVGHASAPRHLGSVPGLQGRRTGGSAAVAAAPPPGPSGPAVTSTPPGGSGPAAIDAPTHQTAPGAAGAGRLPRRRRRSAKHHQQQQEQQQQQQGLPACMLHYATAASAWSGASAPEPCGPQPSSGKHRQTRSRRRGGSGPSASVCAGGNATATCARAPASPAGDLLATASTLAAAALRQPVPSRVRGPKATLSGGVAKLTSSSLLQQPEHQLQLKLKLLQLQREQEEEGNQEGEGTDGSAWAHGPAAMYAESSRGSLASLALRAGAQGRTFDSTASREVPLLYPSSGGPHATALMPTTSAPPAPIGAVLASAARQGPWPARARDRESTSVCSVLHAAGNKDAVHGAVPIVAGDAATATAGPASSATASATAAVAGRGVRMDAAAARRRRRRRPAEAVNQDDGRAPSGWVARVVPVHAPPRRPNDVDNDVLAVAARRVLQERSGQEEKE